MRRTALFILLSALLGVQVTHACANKKAVGTMDETEQYRRALELDAQINAEVIAAEQAPRRFDSFAEDLGAVLSESLAASRQKKRFIGGDPCQASCFELKRVLPSYWENEASSDTDAGPTCTICLDALPEVYNHGCGHLVCCEKCFFPPDPETPGQFRKIEKCPLCPEQIFSFSCLRADYTQKNFPCLRKNCRNKARVFHDTCGELILCLKCASEEGSDKVRTCIRCKRGDGSLRAVYLSYDE